MSKRTKRAVHGWINLCKPYDMTSTQAVGAVKRIISPTKIGHAGTLDPLATGILPLALGEATKTVAYMMDARKAYRFTLCFGTQTTTDDIEGDVVFSNNVRPSDADITEILPRYVGNIMQMPPAFSALKVQGQRAYDLARAGEAVTLAPRPVAIESLTLLERPDADHAVCELVCGKGTYVRSLARDIARDLGAYGHVSQLHRSRVGCFTDDSAISLDDLAEYDIDNHIAAADMPWCHPVECVLDDIPALTLDSTQARCLRHGQSCFVSEALFAYADDEAGKMYQAKHGGVLIALVARQGRAITPVRGFNL